MTPARAWPTLSEWLAEEPFGLALSAGFFGFFAHAGVLRTLEDAGHRPRGVRGASAGALVGGLWAGGMDAGRIADLLTTLKRADFWDPRPGPGLLAGRRFRARLEAVLPGRFRDGRVPLAVSVFDVLARRTVVLEDGELPRAVHASCAFPGLLQPVWIGGRPFLDGGIADRAALEGVRPGERLLAHHLSSRSPWRRRGSPALEAPRRANLVAVVLDGLPRVGPFRLEVGPRALDRAAAAMRRALASPVVDGVVRLEA